MEGKVTICSVGDLMICDSPLYAGVGVGSKYSGIKGKLFSNCKEVFDSADIVIGDFETVVYEPVDKSLDETQMYCPEEVVQELCDACFSVLNLANNHCMQHGVESFENTRRTCERYGIQPIGIRDEEPYIMETNGVKLAFLSLCIHLEWYEPDYICYENRIERILKTVQEQRVNDQNLIIVVIAHWGDEFATYPSNAQIALAHKLVDYGANIILGHHSHVYQGIEEYNDGIIAYGQGNFISDMVPEMGRQTGIMRVEIDNEAGKKINYKLLPYEIKNDYIPAPNEGKWFAERQESLSEALKGHYSDADYWRTVARNYSKAHNDFKNFFVSNISKYKLGISSKMIGEFVGRKIQRIIGNSSDGQVSSMDSVIFAVLGKVD